jgi:hypothetical protein
MQDEATSAAEGATSLGRGGTWAGWLLWGWAGLLFLVALAELTGWEDLRLALDVQRHLRPR